MNTTANANLFSRLFDRLDDPNQLAIETLDGQRVSYGDLVARTARWRSAGQPRPQTGRSRRGARGEVGLWPCAYLATVRAGAVYLPLNTAYTLNELEYSITDAEPALVVCDSPKVEGIGAIAAKVHARVETLCADGRGSLTEAADQASKVLCRVRQIIPYDVCLS